MIFYGLILCNTKKSNHQPTHSSDVELALFNKTEAEQLEANQFVKDDSYRYRNLLMLKNITESNNTKKAYERCSLASH